MSEGGMDRWVCRCENPLVDQIIRDESYCGRCKKRIAGIRKPVDGESYDKDGSIRPVPADVPNTPDGDRDD